MKRCMKPACSSFSVSPLKWFSANLDFFGENTEAINADPSRLLSPDIRFT